MTCGRTQPCDLPAIDFSLLALKDYKKVMLKSLAIANGPP